MSGTLRQRFLADAPPNSSNDSSRQDSPSPAVAKVKEAEGDEYNIIPRDALKSLRSKAKGRRPWRRYVSTFSLGGVFALVAAAFFTTPKGSLDKLVAYAGLEGMSLDSIMDVLPAGLIRDVSALQSREKETVNYDSFAVGLQAQSEGIEAKFPVIMVPGVISTGLESWGTDESSRQYFRKRLWGSWSMMRALVLDKPNWKRHVMLDKKTGLDPPGIKLRAAQGFDAADFFITGYWIWNKILENLATIGYEPGNAFTAAYDWRLTYMNLEVRDQYFTRLKTHIETAKQVSGRKTVLLSHSMGSQVLYYFMHWVEAEGYGNGGSSWIEDHVDSWINISGCMLGALKDVTAILSGEMRDTAQLNAFAVYGLEKFLSRQERSQIFRAMPGISSMLPIGGDAVWGDATGAPDDQANQSTTYGKFLSFKPLDNTTTHSNLTVSSSLPFLHEHTEDWYTKSVKRSYSQGVARSRRKVEANQLIPRKWINPLETRLPIAPNMKIYCFYGIGKPTERAYFYREDIDPATNSTTLTIDTTVSSADGLIDRGVVMGEGDGTVNLLSTGYMCNRGWKIPRYNPSNISVISYEMPHEPERFNPRGGPNTADHVDILGRSSLNDLILRVAGGKGERIEETIFSNIKEYAAKVRIPYEDDEDEENIDPATTMDDDDAHSILSNVKAFMGEISAQRQASVEAAREYLKRKGILVGGALEHAKEFVKEQGEHAKEYVKEKGEGLIHDAREKIHEAKEAL